MAQGSEPFITERCFNLFSSSAHLLGECLCLSSLCLQAGAMLASLKCFGRKIKSQAPSPLPVVLPGALGCPRTARLPEEGPSPISAL